MLLTNYWNGSIIDFEVILLMTIETVKTMQGLFMKVEAVEGLGKRTSMIDVVNDIVDCSGGRVLNLVQNTIIFEIDNKKKTVYAISPSEFTTLKQKGRTLLPSFTYKDYEDAMQYVDFVDDSAVVN